MPGAHIFKLIGHLEAEICQLYITDVDQYWESAGLPSIIFYAAKVYINILSSTARGEVKVYIVSVHSPTMDTLATRLGFHTT